ncbi:hypothetical protein PR048_003701 [Dryococelus australis]|uniref:Uncharacterized protein n=1 Tax=Dryococelus australis TaxID=614101 RepID=A0ABQ9IPQ6_9NEOP|nr:hypothetical protein PR048_003701 [Dryococelus australis]
MQGRGKREIPEKTRRPAASPSTIPTCENPGVARSVFEPGSSRCELDRGFQSVEQEFRFTIWHDCKYDGENFNEYGISQRPKASLAEAIAGAQ